MPNPHASSLRAHATPSEKKLWYQFLRTHPIRFRRQQPIGPYIADFYCSKAKLVIEADGGGHYSPAGQQYDLARTEFLRQNGLAVLRFTNTDIQLHFPQVCEAIETALRQRLSLP